MSDVPEDEQFAGSEAWRSLRRETRRAQPNQDALIYAREGEDPNNPDLLGQLREARALAWAREHRMSTWPWRNPLTPTG